MRHVYGFVVSAWIIWQTLCQVTHKHNGALSQTLEKYFSRIYSLRNEISIARRNPNAVSFWESRSTDRSLREIKYAKGRANLIKFGTSVLHSVLSLNISARSMRKLLKNVQNINEECSDGWNFVSEHEQIEIDQLRIGICEAPTRLVSKPAPLYLVHLLEPYGHLSNICNSSSGVREQLSKLRNVRASTSTVWNCADRYAFLDLK